MSDLIDKLYILDRYSWTQSIYAIAFSFLLSLLGCQNTATSSADAGESTKPPILRVATSGDYTPFSEWAVTGEPAGFSISVAGAYAREIGAALEWVRFEWSNLSADLNSGSFDFALSGVTVRPDRSMLGRFSLPLTTSGAIVLVDVASPLETQLDLDRASVRLAVNAGGHLEKVARRLFPNASVLAVPDNGRVVEYLELGRVDAIVSDSLEAPHWRAKARSRLRMIGPLTRNLKAGWFPAGREDEAQQFNRWLIKAEQEGTLDRLRHQHGLSATATARPKAALLASVDERLTLMRAVAEAKAILDLPIENSDREELVLDSASRAIANAALEAEIAPPEAGAIRRLFRAQIEAAKWIQAQTLRSSPDRGLIQTSDESDESDEKVAARAKLDRVIRPALIYLGDRISLLIIACAKEGNLQLRLEDVDLALEKHHFPESHLRELHLALAAVLGAKDQTSQQPSRERKHQAKDPSAESKGRAHDRYFPGDQTMHGHETPRG